MEEVTTLVSGNIGSAVILIVLWKSGLLKYLLEKKNGNGHTNGDHQLYEYRLDEYSKNLEKLTETANHNFTSLVDKFEKHEELDREQFTIINGKLDTLIRK